MDYIKQPQYSFIHAGRKYKAKESHNGACRGCAFLAEEIQCISLKTTEKAIRCMPSTRDDEKYIIWVKVTPRKNMKGRKETCLSICGLKPIKT